MPSCAIPPNLPILFFLSQSKLFEKSSNNFSFRSLWVEIYIYRSDIMLSTRFLFCSFTFAVAIVTAADLLEDTNLFSDTTSSTVSFDNLDSNDLLNYVENPGSNMFVENDNIDSTVFAENECAIPLVTTRRMRRRSNQCPAPSPQLQLPTLDDIPLENGVGSTLDSMKNEEVCSPLVFGARNIPVCSSGNRSDREYIWADYGYSLKRCTLCKFPILLSRS